MTDPPLLHETKALDPWQPEQNPVRLAILGKLAEELGELSAIVARCIIQGVDKAEPVTGVGNKDALLKEIADVIATSDMVTQHFDLNLEWIELRRVRKVAHLRRWHELIEKEL